MFYPLGKNSEKPYGLCGEGGGGIHPPLYVRGLKFVKINNNVNYDVGDDDADDDDHDDDDDDGGEERSHQNPQGGGEAASTVNQGFNVQLFKCKSPLD